MTYSVISCYAVEKQNLGQASIIQEIYYFDIENKCSKLLPKINTI